MQRQRAGSVSGLYPGGAVKALQGVQAAASVDEREPQCESDGRDPAGDFPDGEPEGGGGLCGGHLGAVHVGAAGEADRSVFRAGCGGDAD